MNKAKIEKMAKARNDSASAQKNAIQERADSGERHDFILIDDPCHDKIDFAGMSSEAFQARIYAALVGATDYTRTMSGEGTLFRIAFERSQRAVDAWKKFKAEEA